MAFSRAIEPAGALANDDLTAAMAGIGMLFGGTADPAANIEDTLLYASAEGVDRADFRVLAVLVTWLEHHSPRVNVDRLTRIAVLPANSERLRAFWSAIAAWQKKDARFRRLAAAYTGARIDLQSAGADFQIRRHGEDPRFERTSLRVPANLLRDRPVDVLAPIELAKRHLGYRFRVLLGPSYRADMFAELTRDPNCSAAELARRTHGSFATAWQVRRDFALLENCPPIERPKKTIRPAEGA